ncbi:hypothetical protein [Hyunsoonleella flava]|uniref:hypothetical protein n=1 Tax=Hyunsoonleella flava TaxID=2527939 RepID=UPI0013EF55C0|nr:hypothetical protein [Hyunsoonleella flava]
MLSDKQSLVLTGLMAVGIFVFGVLDILDNFLVLTILTLVFFAILINLLYSNYRHKQD